MIKRNLAWAQNFQASIYWERPAIDKELQNLDDFVPRDKAYTIDDLKRYYATFESETDTSTWDEPSIYDEYEFIVKLITSAPDGSDVDDSFLQEVERDFGHLKGVMKKGPSIWEKMQTLVNKKLRPELEEDFCK